MAEDVASASPADDDDTDQAAETHPAETADPGSEARDQGGRRPEVRLAVAVGAVVVAAVAGLAGWTSYGAWKCYRADQQRELFLRVARQSAHDMTTISHSQVDSDVQRILDVSIGQFHDEFAQRRQPFIEHIKQEQSTSQGTVAEAGLESIEGDSARALVTVSVKLTKADNGEQKLDGFRLRIDLQRVGAGGQSVRGGVRAMTGLDDGDDEATDAPSVEIDADAEAGGDAQSEAVQENSPDTVTEKVNRQTDWSRVLGYGVLPGLALLLALVAGFSQWEKSSARAAQIARAESLAAAQESTIAILSYQPDSVEKSLVAARDRLTAPYKDAYTKLTGEVVIPGAKKDHVSVTATIPAAASVSATPQHAVVTLFVDQAAAVGGNPPTTTESSIRVTLEKIRGRWLISGFDPI